MQSARSLAPAVRAHTKVVFMNKIFYIIVFFFISAHLYSQQASLRTQASFSDNRQYCVSVTGYFYEGFVNDQRILLSDIKGDTLWQKVVSRRFLILPSVSNNGDVAITHREIKIFNKNNELKGVFTFAKGESPVDYQEPVHGFSSKGDRYFIFIHKIPLDKNKLSNVFLVCFDDSARKIWESNFGDYKPHGILFYKDKIIVHDCGFAGSDYLNGCYIYNMDGNVLWQHETDSKNGLDWRVTLNQSNGFLYLIDKTIETKIMLDSLVLIKK